jgi:hypothetical protein
VLYQDVGAARIAAGRLQEIPLPALPLQHEFNAVWAKGSIYGEEYDQIAQELGLASNAETSYNMDVPINDVERTGSNGKTQK